jgi:hypothetical protein
MDAQQSRTSQRLPYDYLSAQERRVLEQYKREQAWLEHRAEAAPATTDPFSVLDAFASPAASASASTPYKLDATKLDESVPSTITEETSLRDDSRHTDVDANGSLNTSRADDDDDNRAADRSFERKTNNDEVALYSPSEPVQRGHVPLVEFAKKAQTTTGAPFQVDMALAQLPALPVPDHSAAAAATSASLSSLMRVSDLAYPELLLQGYNNSSSARSLQPWRTPQHIPTPLAPPQAAMPTAAEWMEQRQRERREERQQRELDTRDDALHASMRQRLHDGFARILDPAASTGGAVESSSFFASSGHGPKKDSNGGLLESLWAAEADFERMLAEELPEVRLPQHRNSRQRQQRAAPAPRPTPAVAAERPHTSPAQTPKSAASSHPMATAVASSRQYHATSATATASPRSPPTRSQRAGFVADNLAASPRRSPQRQQQQEEQVAYRPGALLQPRDEVKVAFLDVPLPQANNARRPDIGGRQLQRALEEAQSSAAHDFLHVASWDADLASEADAVDVEELKSSAGNGDVLLAVEDFVMPAALAELLDVDVDPVSGRLARFQPQHQPQASDCFGRLVPMRVTQILNQVEREGRAAGLTQQSQSPSSSPRLAHSHLHAGPDPATLQRHIAMRRAKESMREMDEELEVRERQTRNQNETKRADRVRGATSRPCFSCCLTHVMSCVSFIFVFSFCVRAAIDPTRSRYVCRISIRFACHHRVRTTHGQTKGGEPHESTSKHVFL